MNTTLAQFLKPELLLTMVLIIVVSIFIGNSKFSVIGFTALCNALNTRGGNIILLATMFLIVNAAALKFIYYMIGMGMDGKITSDNALGMAAFSYVTGQISGNITGAFLKALSPQDMPSPGTTTSTVASTVTAPKPVEGQSPPVPANNA